MAWPELVNSKKETKKKSKILKILKKKSSLRWRDLIMGKNRINLFLHFSSQNDSIRKKKQNIFFEIFDPGDGMECVECAPKRVKMNFSVGVTYMVGKLFIRAIF